MSPFNSPRGFLSQDFDGMNSSSFLSMVMSMEIEDYEKLLREQMNYSDNKVKKELETLRKYKDQFNPNPIQEILEDEENVKNINWMQAARKRMRKGIVDSE